MTPMRSVSGTPWLPVVAAVSLLCGAIPDSAAETIAETPTPYPSPTNPVGFSYPYFNGTNEVTKTEVRDPAIIREGDTYYMVFTHYHVTTAPLFPATPDLNFSHP